MNPSIVKFNLGYINVNYSAKNVRANFGYDGNGILIATGTPNGFRTSGYSLNLDYKISDNAFWRVEFRGLNSKDDIFLSDNEPVNDNYFVTTSLTIAF